MWHARYVGPRDDVALMSYQSDDWREALNASIGQIKTVAPMGTYVTLINATAYAKPNTEWFTTDGTHTFSISRNAAIYEDDPLALLDGDAPGMAEDEIRRGINAEEGIDESETVHGRAAEICLARVAKDPDGCGGGAIGYHAIGEPGGCPECVLEAKANPVPDHTAREHSELGASIAERWMNCSASVRLVRDQPNPSSLAAQRGTAAHEVAHMCLMSGQDAVEYIGRTVNGIEIDVPIADGVQEYLDHVRACPATEKFYEVKFDLDSLGAPAPMYGTADFMGYDALEQVLYIDDYKNGFVYVDPKTPQARYYALGGMLALGADKPVSQIVVTIVQPNSLGATLKTDTFDAIELVEWGAELIAAAYRTQDPDAPAVAGPWCDKTFCPIRGKCSVRADASLKAAQIEFADYMTFKTPEVRLLTAAERGAIHGAATALKDFLDAVEESIKADTDGTGWKLVLTDPRSAWLDKDAAALALQLEHGIDPYEPQEVISPAAARGKLKDVLHAGRVASHTTGRKPTKKAAEDDARKALADLVTLISGGTKLVPEADSRPAIPTNGAEFDNVKV